ncbi:unnamed protein product, partial [Calicophoron daubneyi]
PETSPNHFHGGLVPFKLIHKPTEVARTWIQSSTRQHPICNKYQCFKSNYYEKSEASSSVVHSSPPQKDEQTKTYIVENIGSYVEITFIPQIWYTSFLKDRIKQYEIANLRFHWGSMKSYGSEYTKNGKANAA